MIRITESRDADLLALLNYDMQEIHAEIEPMLFKHHNQENMKALFKEALEDENIYAFVAWDNDRPVGYVMISKINFEENYFRKSYSVVYIEHICVLKDYKGHGIGKQLIEKVKEFARDNNIRRVELDYWNKNEKAGQFFRSQGFKTFNERMYLEV